MSHEINVRKKTCPIPVLMTRHALEKMKGGEVLKVVGDLDDFAHENIVRWAKREGHKVLQVTKTGAGFTLMIRKR